jgi:hypothetical protein
MSVLGFNNLVRHLIQETTVSSFKFILFQKQLECVGVNFLCRCQKCMDNNRAFPLSVVMWGSSIYNALGYEVPWFC